MGALIMMGGRHAVDREGLTSALEALVDADGLVFGRFDRVGPAR
jgi:hypothetical protein